MHHNKNQSLQKPEKPKPDECCGGGSCCPCVWDAYRQQLAIYNQALKKLENTEKPEKETKLQH